MKYFKQDKNGYIMNRGTAEKILKHWRPAIEELKNAYLGRYGNLIYAMYVVGSVASGLAKDYVSDLDFMCILDLPQKKLDYDAHSKWLEKINKKSLKKYPFITNIDAGLLSFEKTIKDNKPPQVCIRIESVLVYGNDITKILPLFKVGPQIVVSLEVLPRFLKQLKKSIIFLKKPKNKRKFIKFRKNKCYWLARLLLRAAFELVMKKVGKYTKDIDQCYKDFIKYYPDKKDVATMVLHLSKRPSSDISKIEELINGFGKWIIKNSETIN